MELFRDPFSLCLALGPIAIYLMLLGAINLARRPFLVSGTRDVAALGLAVSGLVIVGPMELFFPNSATAHYHAAVWLFMLTLYLLLLVLLLLLVRPRLVIYNMAAGELRPVLSTLAVDMDPEARWAGDSLTLPNLGVQLHLDCVPSMRNITLVSSGPSQNHQGWRRLERALATRLAQVEGPRNPRAVSFLTSGSLIALFIILSVARDPQAVAQALFNLLKW